MNNRVSAIALAFTSALAAVVYAGSTEFRGGTIVQDSGPGAVGQDQVLIINNDRFGNQQTLRIGGGGQVITKLRPCDRDTPVQAMDCSGADLRGVDWRAARLTASRFDGADLRGASLAGAELDNASFVDAKLDAADLGGAALVNNTFARASLVGASLRKAELVNGEFARADLSRADLSGAQLINVGFIDSDLRGAVLRDATFVNIDFISARLGGATWVDGRRCADGSESGCRR